MRVDCSSRWYIHRHVPFLSCKASGVASGKPRGRVLVKSWAMPYSICIFYILRLPHVIQYHRNCILYAIIIALVDVLFLTVSHARARHRRRRSHPPSWHMSVCHVTVLVHEYASPLARARARHMSKTDAAKVPFSALFLPRCIDLLHQILVRPFLWQV
jgi:hypothetical protein